MAGKRGNGEGSLRRKENGKWEAQIMLGYRPDGSRDIRSFTASTRKEAQNWLDKIKSKWKAGLLEGEDWWFVDWTDFWFENHKDSIKPTTQESYGYTVEILKKNFGKYRLPDIKTMHVEQLLRKLRKEGRSDSYIAQCRGLLFMIMKKAAANDLILKNPVEFADKMRKRPPKRKEAFTADEVRLPLKHLPDDRIGWSIRLLLFTGMRTQELLGLEPRHIAKDGSSINIAQAVVMEKGTVAIGTPKSYDSYRTIPVPESWCSIAPGICARRIRSLSGRWGSRICPAIPATSAMRSRKQLGMWRVSVC